MAETTKATTQPAAPKSIDIKAAVLDWLDADAAATAATKLATEREKVARDAIHAARMRQVAVEHNGKTQIVSFQNGKPLSVREATKL